MIKFPDGILVEHGGWIYRVAGNKLLPLVSWRAAQSWNQPILVGPDDIVAEYEKSSAKLGFRPTAILESFETGQRYFIEGAVKRKITNPDFWELGFNEFENYLVTEDELNFHKDGEPIG